MKISDFGSRLKAYQAGQQASFVKNLFSGGQKKSANIFTKTDVFTYQPISLSDIFNARYGSELQKLQKLDISNLPKSEVILLDEDGLPRHGYIDAANDKIKIRERKNNDIENLLSENGIKISEGEKFSFSVDSKTLNVIVSGENSDKAKQIETVLNNNKFGKEIISTANQACLKQEEIASHIQMRKYNANQSLQYKFGCSLDDITFGADGTPYLPNGQSIAEALSGGADTKPMLSSDNEMTKAVGEAFVEAYLRPLREIYNAGGADAISDFTVTIDYDKNGYIDTMTDGYGFGKDQLGWYDKMKSLRGDAAAITAYGSKIFA
ncbi:MAG: DUF4885 domain-containing protein [Ruminococcus sp.]|jgi:hypothetical protein|nr:DUF4885 domain-containing protein [Ruminococcus sp.]